jgi:hypothetical protein
MYNLEVSEVEPRKSFTHAATPYNYTFAFTFLINLLENMLKILTVCIDANIQS